MKYICPSVLGCDLSNLQSECAEVIEAGCDWVHLDVMDGHFVPNISFGPPVIKALRAKISNAVLDCHVMATNPVQWVLPLSEAGASNFTFHIEAIDSQEALESILKLIKQCNMKTGIAIKPSTSVPEIMIDAIRLGLVDLALVMTVEPGFGGQRFIDSTMTKVSFFREKFPDLVIQVDGGINYETIQTANRAGANAFVLGTYIFSSTDRKNTISELQKVIQNN
jgi:ribulose-phosphate 3-epimerase